MPIKVQPIQPADISSVVSCIQIAFDSDPYNNWLFDKRTGKFDAQRNFDSLKIKCEWGMRNAMFYVAKDTDGKDPDQVVGVSMWMKPRRATEPVSWSEWWDGYVLWVKQGVNVLWYRGWGGMRTRRYWVWKREQALAQSKVWDDPEGYYFCNIITVLPGLQGKGIGKKMFDVVTQMADDEGRKCYLESSRDIPNTAIYNKLGFETKVKLVCEEGGEKCDLFAMVREPQPILNYVNPQH